MVGVKKPLGRQISQSSLTFDSTLPDRSGLHTRISRIANPRRTVPHQSRRSSLGLLAAAAAGCLDGAPPDRWAGREPRRTGRGADAGPERTPATNDPVRCRGDPVAVERSITDEPGYNDEIEHFLGNGQVHLAGQPRRSGGPRDVVLRGVGARRERPRRVRRGDGVARRGRVLADGAGLRAVGDGAVPGAAADGAGDGTRPSRGQVGRPHVQIRERDQNAAMANGRHGTVPAEESTISDWPCSWILVSGVPDLRGAVGAGAGRTGPTLSGSPALNWSAYQ